MAEMKKALRVLQRFWKHPEFRKDQRTVIELALDGNDVVAVLPTSAGKSACFQIPAMLRPGCAIVISPLIALMKDQVDDCNRRGIPATYINSHVDDDERDERLADVLAGAYKLLYVAPERLSSKRFLGEIARAEVSFIVCDEAHCTSEYGHDFRPDYMRCNRLVVALTKHKKRPPILAMTATATQKVLVDIVKSLGMNEDHALVVGDPIRSNITYVVDDVSGGGFAPNVGRAYIERLDLSSGRHIIYALTRRMAEEFGEFVYERHGIQAAYYHAGMAREDRERVQDAFKDGNTPIVCATVAFGMGVDVPNIRTVLNVGIPGSIEAMVQQCGRAGRDGKPSTAVVISDDWSIDFQMSLIERENPPWVLYGRVWEWLHTHLAPGETLKRTLRDLASQMTIDFRMRIDESQLGSVLGAMHSKGLVEKRAVDAGTPIRVDSVVLNDLLRGGKLPPPIRRVGSALWDRYVRPALEADKAADPRDVQVDINKHAVKDDAQVSSYYTQKALEVLSRQHAILHVGETFTGNQVKILTWRAPLDEHLSQEKIEAKRAIDFGRFRAMTDFVRCETAEQRNAFLRRYFLSTEGPLVVPGAETTSGSG